MNEELDKRTAQMLSQREPDIKHMFKDSAYNEEEEWDTTVAVLQVVCCVLVLVLALVYIL